MQNETKISVERSKEIAGTILSQLGGRQFLVMTGTKPKYCDGYTSTFELTRNKLKAKYMQVTLNSMDTYDIRFSKMNTTTGEVTILKECNGIYNDGLAPLFEQVTGLYTKLW